MQCFMGAADVLEDKLWTAQRWQWRFVWRRRVLKIRAIGIKPGVQPYE